MWLNSFVFLACGIRISIGTSIDFPYNECYDSCNCCNSNPDDKLRELGDICDNKHGSNWICKYGCIEGYWGGKCWHDCPNSCSTCHRDYRNNRICYSCAEGYYNGTDVTNCSTPCPPNCAGNQCNKTSGNCLQDCTSNNWSGEKCSVCADTWYGNNCDKPCPTNCTDSKCYTIGDGNDWNCTYGCKDGYYGGRCLVECPTTCTRCDRKYHDNQICYLCADGYYGTSCKTNCSINCQQNQCNKTTGNCLHGCKSNNWRGDKCNVCADTWYGNNCDIECSNICKDKLCGRNGGCTSGCANENFAGLQCDHCKTGKYGNNCDENCSENCKNNVCDRDDGTCTDGCKVNFVGDRCNECVNGMFGDSCDKTCSIGCKSSVCTRNSAICSQGCKDSYSGDKCCVSTAGCDKCGTTTTCSKCKPGNYGNACGKTCPVNCTGACNKDTGNCESCKEGKFHGVQCGTQCSANCRNGKCVQENGQCIACKVGYYDETCNKTCPDNCLNNVCGQHDGICNNCIVGFHGGTCNRTCGKACTPGTCIQDSGRCEDEPAPPSPIGPAVGGSIGALVVIALIVLGVLFLIRRRRLQQDENKNITTDGPTSDINNSITDSDEYRNVYENCDSLADRENVQLVPVVEAKHEPDFHDVAKQVPAEPDGEDEDIDDDYYTFRNVINVVDLPKYVTQKAGENLSNEFKGNQQQNAYIASLGPTRVTTENFATFWKMVWYEKSDVIVMLTNLQEPSGMKCEQYWPNLGQTLNLPDFEIKCDSMEDFSEYTLRTFTVTKDNERRTVNQLHYTAWPDKSIPKNVTSLVEFRQRVKSTHTLSQGPVVVHCSAGIGRTGTYIAIDLLTEEGLTEGSVDVFGCIRNMREQRVNMVQTSDQYEYVHRAIVYTLTLDVDYTPTETFNEHVMSLNDSLYGVMFKKLKQPIEFAHPENEIAVTANKRETNKNRPGSDVPGNESRPMLYLNRGFNDSNYINAVYIDGFKRRNRFILAQTPLSSTLEDFVCLIYQDKCSCVVSVEVTDNRKQDVGCYIPQENQSLSFGSFVVTCMKFQNKYNHQYRKLKIQNNGKQADGERIVNHFQYTNWKNTEKVPSSEADFVQFINDAQSSAQEDGLSPLLLHCLTGGEKCGLFCTVSLLLERADIIRQISVVNTVRLLRLGRPNVIPNKEQLKFAHQCVASQMEMHSAYSNFSMK
ncbi:Protein tyrosine phosphatase [Mactra antiquata]